ncbi:hypothetical protein D3C80_1666910 [compost metagenome]
MLCDEDIGRITDATHTIMHHFIYTQLGSRAKTVFQRTQDAVGIMPVSFKLQYRINHMFQYFRAGNTTLFSNMPDYGHRCIGLFGKTL